jgi:hypothetical protein
MNYQTIIKQLFSNPHGDHEDGFEEHECGRDPEIDWKCDLPREN